MLQRRGVFLLERTLSAEERIRRAEEIYYKRKMQNLGVRVGTNEARKNTKPNYKLFQKLIVQVLICITIYIIFYLIQNSNYIFSENVLNGINGILSYDINFQKIYQDVSGYISSIQNKENKEENGKTEGDNSNLVQNNNLNENNSSDENIGGANEEQDKTEENAENKTEGDGNSNEGLSQMEIDAKYIKNKYSLQKPLTGKITSRFGMRNPTTPTVPKNHTGIDIAANTGTVIYAALDGTVTKASSEGDYGKHLRIEKDDIAIYYAHCSKLYVKKGDKIKKGQKIAEVGATGNVTGPHLHFEIRRNERYVDPDLILKF